MRLYHGSNTAFREVDLSLCRPNKDFGQGFYLAPDRIAAERMARRTVRRFGGKACLMTFEFDEALLADVPVKLFQRPSEEWAMFVMANRRPNVEAADHNRDNRYGMVVGPVANDDLALLFRQFALGLVTVEMLVREMQFKQLTTQYSFHTPVAVSALKFVGVDDVYSIKQKQLMEYATQDIVAMVAEREGLSIQDAMGVVYHSRLHEKLHDVETGLYLEGSEYLYGLLYEERSVKDCQ